MPKSKMTMPIGSAFSRMTTKAQKKITDALEREATADTHTRPSTPRPEMRTHVAPRPPALTLNQEVQARGFIGGAGDLKQYLKDNDVPLDKLNGKPADVIKRAAVQMYDLNARLESAGHPTDLRSLQGILSARGERVPVTVTGVKIAVLDIA